MPDTKLPMLEMRKAAEFPDRENEAEKDMMIVNSILEEKTATKRSEEEDGAWIRVHLNC